ncbi:MAG: PRC-barrel domain-containing protein [Desulfuromonadales bacterium]
MRKAATMTAVAFLASMAFAGTALAADQKQSQQMGQQQQQQKQQQISNASDVQKFSVQTAQGEKLGKVDKVVLDLQQGQIGYVIVSATEGQDKYIIPWKALKAQPQEQALVLNISADMLKQAPKGDIQQVLNKDQGRQIHQYYGVAPYWEGSQQKQQQDKSNGSMMDQERFQPDQKQPGQTQPGM